jgi:hypothetical protein
MQFDLGAVTDAAQTSLADCGVVWTWEWLIYPVWSALGGGRDDTDAPVAAERLFTRANVEVLAAVPKPLRRAPARSTRPCWSSGQDDRRRSGGNQVPAKSSGDAEECQRAVAVAGVIAGAGGPWAHQRRPGDA